MATNFKTHQPTAQGKKKVINRNSASNLTKYKAQADFGSLA
jgi:hypothetical protein